MMKVFIKFCLQFLIIFTLFSCLTTNESGRTQLMMISETEENRMGNDYYTEVLSKSKLSKNEKWIRLVKQVGERLSKTTGKDFKWEYNIIESKDINAWALPGGKIAFYEGIMNIFENEAEIAVVMAHEIGHVVLRHGGERMSQGAVVNILGSVLQAFTPDVQGKELYLGAFAGITTYGVILPYSRAHEYEADGYGVMLMAKAGYDPKVSIKFWEKMSALSKSGKVPEFFSTHPSDENRIENMKALLPDSDKEFEKTGKKFGTGEKMK